MIPGQSFAKRHFPAEVNQRADDNDLSEQTHVGENLKTWWQKQDWIESDNAGDTPAATGS
jgi:hypothetical protein